MKIRKRRSSTARNFQDKSQKLFPNNDNLYFVTIKPKKFLSIPYKDARTLKIESIKIKKITEKITKSFSKYSGAFHFFNNISLKIKHHGDRTYFAHAHAIIYEDDDISGTYEIDDYMVRIEKLENIEKAIKYIGSQIALCDIPRFKATFMSKT